MQELKIAIPSVEKAVTGKLVEKTFEVQKGVSLSVIPNIIHPNFLGYEGDREELLLKHRVKGIPDEWKESHFKNEIIKEVEYAINKVMESDVMVLTGGRDYPPELLGNKRKKQTQDYSIFDARDVVETYMLMTALAHGKTLHTTCRGFQVLTTNMIKTFSPDSEVEINQHLPKLLKRHSGKSNTDQHSGGDLKKGFSQIITEKNWYKQILNAQLEGKKPIFASFEGSSHLVNVTEDCLLKDSLLIAKKKGGRDIIDLEGVVSTPMSSLHHQGFAYVSKSQRKALVSALKEAGGVIDSLSGDPRDQFVNVVESVSYSKQIGKEELEAINKRVDFVNQVLGMEISIPQPDLEKPIRFDAPHAAQSHPELNIAGIALVIPSLINAFARDKKQALSKGEDLNGYKEWSASQGRDKLFEIARNSIDRQKY